MFVLAVIPARGGSKGVPAKNLRALGGKPLVAWTIEAALGAPSVSRVILSTDDDAIAAAGSSYGDIVPFRRPADLATDTAPTLPVVQHAVRFVESAGTKVDIVLLLQPTTPMRRSSDIEKGLAKMAETGCDAVVSITDVGGNHPFRMKRLVAGDHLVNFIDQGQEDMRPRQLLPPVYIREGSIYIAKRDLVMRSGALVGGDVRGLVIPPERTVNIDTMADFERAERLMRADAEESAK